MVERYLPGISDASLHASVVATAEVVRQMAAEGHAISYLACTLVPDDEVVLCLFEAQSSQEVVEANQRSGMPFGRIVPARGLLIPKSDAMERIGDDHDT